jgi:hypothetical protein
MNSKPGLYLATLISDCHLPTQRKYSCTDLCDLHATSAERDPYISMFDLILGVVTPMFN